MRGRWLRGVLFAASAVALAAASAVSAPEEPLTVDDVLKRMNEETSAIKDLRAAARVTRYDSITEEKHQLRMEFFCRRPYLTRVDTYRTRQGREMQTEQVIIGEDYVVRVQLRPDPKDNHGERRWMDAEEVKRRREDRNDPFTFFSRQPDDLKKDFDVKLLAPAKAGEVKLHLTRRNEKVQFDYEAVELLVDTQTWLPKTIRTMEGTDEDDWSLYEFSKVRVNGGLEDSDFEPVKGVKIEEVDQRSSAAKK